MAWRDRRTVQYAVYFLRLDATGAALGSEVRVSLAGQPAIDPSVVWTGAEYGIAWQDGRNTGNEEIYFARFSAAGVKIGSDVRVTNNAGASIAPFLVWNGAGYALAWSDMRDGNYEIYFARLSAAGVKIGSDVRVTSDNSSDSGAPSLVWNGSVYGVAWNDNRDGNYEIYFARLDGSGSKLTPPGDVRVTNAANSSSNPSMVWAGGQYGLAWEDLRSGKWEVYFRKLDAVGGFASAEVKVTADAGAARFPSPAWSGGEYGLAWHDDQTGSPEIYVARLQSSDGTKIGGDVRISGGDGSGSMTPSLTWNGSDYGVAWQDYRDGNYEIYFAGIGCAGGAPGPVTGLVFPNTSTLNWNAEPASTRYDVVKGNLGALVANGGNFTTSLITCLENDSGDTQSTDGQNPGSGQGFYYLVRGETAAANGTYNTGGSSQAGDRDAEIELSASKCP
jgi:hypothetical protein